MQTIQEFIFSDEFERGMDKAVECAVVRADAAGLPKAYLHGFDDLALVQLVPTPGSPKEVRKNPTSSGSFE